MATPNYICVHKSAHYPHSCTLLKAMAYNGATHVNNCGNVHLGIAIFRNTVSTLRQIIISENCCALVHIIIDISPCTSPWALQKLEMRPQAILQTNMFVVINFGLYCALALMKICPKCLGIVQFAKLFTTNILALVL